MTTVTGNFETLLQPEYDHALIKASLNLLTATCHGAQVKAGWWYNINNGEPLHRNVGELLMLCVSELSEAMEGDRKNLMDDKLPTRKMFEVELADTLIRIFDLAGAAGCDLAGALVEKMAYNSTRLDHTFKHRAAEGGKKY